MKPTHDDIIKAKQVYSQLSFEIYKKRSKCFVIKVRQYKP